MVENVKTVATQAFQIWLSADLQELGWDIPPVTLTSFVKPFDTWADMGHVVPAENWHDPQPRTSAYFCNVLADPSHEPDPAEIDYPKRRREEVRKNAIEFLNRDIENLWPKAKKQWKRISLGFAGRSERVKRRTGSSCDARALRYTVLDGERQPLRPLRAFGTWQRQSSNFAARQYL